MKKTVLRLNKSSFSKTAKISDFLSVKQKVGQSIKSYLSDIHIYGFKNFANDENRQKYALKSFVNRLSDTNLCLILRASNVTSLDYEYELVKSNDNNTFHETFSVDAIAHPNEIHDKIIKSFSICPEVSRRPSIG